MAEREMGESGWLTTLLMASAWLMGACYNLPALLAPPNLPAQHQSDPNIPVETSAPGPVIVAISGVYAGAQVILSVNNDRVYPALGDGDQTVIDEGNIGDAYALKVSTSSGLSCLPTSATGQLTAAAQLIPLACHASLVLVNSQPARWVIGQSDFVSTGSNNLPASLSRPAGAAFAPSTGYLYIADYGNNRVPVFTPPPSWAPPQRSSSVTRSASPHPIGSLSTATKWW